MGRSRWNEIGKILVTVNKYLEIHVFFLFYMVEIFYNKKQKQKTSYFLTEEGLASFLSLSYRSLEKYVRPGVRGKATALSPFKCSVI